VIFFSAFCASAVFGREPKLHLVVYRHVAETEKGYKVVAELPGMDEKNIEVKIANEGIEAVSVQFRQLLRGSR
jgi:HSP20 family molecular chaperone IbpA